MCRARSGNAFSPGAVLCGRGAAAGPLRRPVLRRRFSRRGTAPRASRLQTGLVSRSAAVLHVPRKSADRPAGKFLAGRRLIERLWRRALVRPGVAVGRWAGARPSYSEGPVPRPCARSRSATAGRPGARDHTGGGQARARRVRLRPWDGARHVDGPAEEVRGADDRHRVFEIARPVGELPGVSARDGRRGCAADRGGGARRVRAESPVARSHRTGGSYCRAIFRRTGPTCSF